MIEQFHAFDKSKFRIVAVHVVDLSAKCFPQTVTGEIAYSQPVFLLQFFEDDIDSLNGVNRTFLADKYRSILTDWSYMRVAILQVLL